MKVSCKAFVDNNNINIPYKEMREIALSDKNAIRHESINYKYENIDHLMIEHNMFCSIDRPVLKEVINQSGYVYIMKIYENNIFNNKVKIGFSSDPWHRAKSLSSSWRPYDISFDVHKVGELLDKPASIEAAIHVILRSRNLAVPVNSEELDGSNEIFYYEEWFDHMI